MNRNHLFGFRRTMGRGQTATGAVLGDVGRQIEGAYNQAAGAAQDAYGDARDSFEDVRRRAEGAFHDARDTAVQLIEQGSDAYDEAAKRSRVYGQQVVGYTRKHPPEALLAAAGFGFLLALIVTRRPLG